MHYNWHRYYDPKTGRYITPDPIGLAGGINPFVYTENDPINAIDPLGLTSVETLTIFVPKVRAPNPYLAAFSGGFLVGNGLTYLFPYLDGPLGSDIYDWLHPQARRWEPKNPYAPSPYPTPKPNIDNPTPTVDDILNKKDPFENTTCETREVKHERPPDDQCGQLRRAMNNQDTSWFKRMAARIAYIKLGCFNK